MSQNCNPCDGTGFANAHQLDDLIPGWTDLPLEEVLELLREVTDPHDVTPCDCCGTGDMDDESPWYGVAGEHYNDDDPQGPHGPYAYNGGLCECH